MGSLGATAVEEVEVDEEGEVCSFRGCGSRCGTEGSSMDALVRHGPEMACCREDGKV